MSTIDQFHGVSTAAETLSFPCVFTFIRIDRDAVLRSSYINVFAEKSRYSVTANRSVYLYYFFRRSDAFILERAFRTCIEGADCYLCATSTHLHTKQNDTEWSRCVSC